MQLITRPIGTFPPLDLRPRFDGAFLYRAPPVIGRLSAGARSRQPTAHSISAGHGRPRIITSISTSISDLSFSSRKAAARRAGGDAATIGGARARKNLRALGTALYTLFSPLRRPSLGRRPPSEGPALPPEKSGGVLDLTDQRADDDCSEIGLLAWEAAAGGRGAEIF
jgi:hypothetical protein